MNLGNMLNSLNKSMVSSKQGQNRWKCICFWQNIIMVELNKELEVRYQWGQLCQRQSNLTKNQFTVGTRCKKLAQVCAAAPGLGFAAWTEWNFNTGVDFFFVYMKYVSCKWIGFKNVLLVQGYLFITFYVGGMTIIARGRTLPLVLS